MYLHCLSLGIHVGAFMVQKMAQRLDVLLKESPHTYSTKECSCVLMIISILYNYRVSDLTTYRIIACIFLGYTYSRTFRPTNIISHCMLRYSTKVYTLKIYPLYGTQCGLICLLP